MKVLTKWTVWYDDGATHSSADGTPESAPLDGVQAITEHFENGTSEIHEGHDYYYWTGDCWAYGNLASLERWLRRELPNLKFGRFTSNAVHLKAVEEASR